MPAVLFLHGLGSDSSCFQAAHEQAFLHGQTLLCPHLPAHGLTPPLARTHNLSAVAKHIYTERACHIVAHSMGAAIGLLMTHRITPLSFISVEGNLLAQDGERLSQRTARTNKDDFVRHNIHRMIARARDSSDPSTRAWGRTMAQTDAAAFHEYAVSTTRWSNSGRLFDLYLELACPKTYIYGESSAVPAVLAQLSQHDLDQHRIKGSGHFPMLEQPQTFWQCVAAFYQRNELFDKTTL
ncbi:MAG: alpha/beta hydrolase [Alphaproteobacteria bacterium GM202ARS2]|nr:alpha/beta hydrolase [Alphaproteobacteria bacterium GM202ARS2]